MTNHTAPNQFSAFELVGEILTTEPTLGIPRASQVARAKA